jgi:flavin reductase (DIM6/NTAB) family NADH-FMN oxidoreductase RutF
LQVDTRAASEAFENMDRELWLITSRDGRRRGGLIATFVSQASLVPSFPRVTVCLAKHHHTRGLIEASGAFAMHLLSEDQLDRVWRFGLCSGRSFDKLEGLPIRAGVTGSPILTDAPGWLDCRCEAGFDIGDRTLYIAGVVDAQLTLIRPALTIKNLMRLAPSDRLQELRLNMARDIEIDAAAISAWRRQKAPGL